ncbi:MAG: tail fiber domain-containing protein [Alphaproteobacteria bacterium]
MLCRTTRPPVAKPWWLWRGVVAALVVAGQVQAADWGTFTLISSTLGNTAGRLCMGATAGLRVGDIGCPTYAPSLTMAGDVSITGNVSAVQFIGDGSGLTGLGVGDRITSSSLSVVANQTTNYVSLTTAGSTWGYFNDALSYLPTLWATRVSATNISGTTAHFSGNVGIGTETPAAPLEIAINGQKIRIGYSAPAFGMDIKAASIGGWARSYGFQNQADQLLGGFGGFGTADAMEYLWMGSSYASPGIVIKSTTGNVGISNTNPVAKLDVTGDVSVSGVVQVGQSTLTCSSAISGSIRYSIPSNTLQVCNSVGWVSLVSGSATAPTVDGAGSANHVAYWSDADTLSYDNAQYSWDATNNRLGIGTAYPSSTVDIYGAAPRFRMKDDNDSTSYFEIHQAAETQTVIRNSTTSGNSMIDISPLPQDGTSTAYVRLFRETSTTSVGKGLQLFRGNGTATADTVLFAGATGKSYIGGNGGSLGVGTSSVGANLQVSGSFVVSSTGQTTTPTMYANTSGNVGIGTTTPAVSLTVAAGEVQVGTSGASCVTATNGGAIRYTGGTLYYCNGSDAWSALSAGGLSGSGTTNYVAKWASASALGTGILYDTGANVGISTTSPNKTGTSNALTVNGSATSAVEIAVDETLKAYMAGGAGYGMLTSYGAIPLYLGSDNAVRMTIASSGNVGIGTTAPSNTLTVSSSTNINGAGNFADRSAPFMVYDHLNDTGIAIDGNQIEQMNSTSKLYLNYNSAADILLAYGGGKVGIGMVAPTTTLQVSGSFTVSTSAQVTTPTLYANTSGYVGIGTSAPTKEGLTISGTSTPGLRVQASNAWDFFTSAVGGRLGIYDATNSRELMTFRTSGKVGVSNTSPVAQFDVTGTISASDIVQVGSTTTIACASSVYGSIRYTNVSDTLQICTSGGWKSLTSSSVPSTLLSGSGTTNYVAKWTGTSALGTGLIYDTGTYVGIGTTIPGAALEISGTATSEQLRLRAASLGGIGLSMYDGGGSANARGWGIVTNAVAWGDFHIKESAAQAGNPLTGNSRLTILSGGYVGIGNSSPGALLNVGAYTDSTQLYSDYPALFVSKAMQSTVPMAEFKFVSGNTGCAGCQNLGVKIQTVDAGGSGKTNIGLQVDASGGAYNYAALFPTGYVGVGTSSPAAALHVSSSSATQTAAVFAGGGSGLGLNVQAGQIQIGSAAGALARLSYDYNQGDVYLDNSYNNAAGDIMFRTRTAGTVVSAVTITGGGNVGVGTTSPGAKLEINEGSLLLKGVYDGTTRLVFNPTTGGGEQWEWYPTTTGIMLYNRTDSASRMNILNDGNMGIGAANPLSKLVVLGTDTSGYTFSSSPVSAFASANPEVAIMDTGNGAGRTATLRLGTNHTTYYTSGAYLRATQGAGVNSYDLQMGTSSSGAATTKMTVQSDGNVGMGQTTPVAKLEINQAKGAATAGAGNAQTATTMLALGDRSSTNGMLTFGVDDANGGWLQSRHATVTGYYPIQLNPLGGNVGIGTNDPKQKLYVAGVTQFANGNVDSSEGVQMYFSDDAYNTTYMHKISTAHSSNNDQGWMKFSVASGASTYNDVMTLMQNGKVGIGTTTPGSLLHVKGTGYEMLRLEGNGSGYAGFSIYNGATTKWHMYNNEGANTFYVADADFTNGVYMDQNASGFSGFSDRRMKTNIKPYSILDKIGDFQSVAFDWKKSGTHDVGVIAQDLYKVFPELVDKGDDDPTRVINRIDEPGVWAVRYDLLGAFAMQGVKELKAANDALVSRTTALEAQLKAANDNDATQDAAIEELRRELRAMAGR